MKMNTTMKKRVITLGAIIIGIVMLAIVGKLIYDGHVSRERAIDQARLSKTIESLHTVYMKPVAPDQTYSGQSEEKHESFLSNAASYYGVDSVQGEYGTAPQPAEIVGACMRQKNIDLAASFRDMDSETVMSQDAEITNLRKMIAMDCYARYSVDGKLPDKFNSAIHNH